MLSNCENLESITWGDSFDTHYAEDFSHMFDSSVSLESLDLTLFNTSSATDFEGMFNNCTKLQTLDISSFSTEHTDDIDNMFLDCKALKTLKLGSKFNPTGFTQTFGRCGSDYDSEMTIWCTDTFKQNLYAHSYAYWDFNPDKVTWLDCETGNPL